MGKDGKIREDALSENLPHLDKYFLHQLAILLPYS